MTHSPDGDKLRFIHICFYSMHFLFTVLLKITSLPQLSFFLLYEDNDLQFLTIFPSLLCGYYTFNRKKIFFSSRQKSAIKETSDTDSTKVLWFTEFFVNANDVIKIELEIRLWHILLFYVTNCNIIFEIEFSRQFCIL